MRKIFILTFFILVNIFTGNSQVTIGSIEKPIQGALLQVKNIDGVTDGSVNSTKGMLMPRVTLQGFELLEPLVATTNSSKNLHIGTLVYNVTDSGWFVPGLYVWNGLCWINLEGGACPIFGPWNEVGSTPATASKLNTTDSYLKAKVVVGGTSVINDAQLSIYGKTTVGENLTITSADTNTGLVLPNGASEGSVLMSDAEGSASWIKQMKRYYTEVTSSGARVVVSVPANSYVKIPFSQVIVDQIKTNLGSQYGFDVSTQEFVAPKDGLYKFFLNIYFTDPATGSIGRNARVYPFKNGVRMNDAGFVSVQIETFNQNGNTSFIVNLKQGDLVDFRVYGGAALDVAFWYGAGHTYFSIESL